jgi:hypothetical protein
MKSPSGCRAAWLVRVERMLISLLASDRKEKGSALVSLLCLLFLGD